MQTAAYLGNFGFLGGNASGKRVLGNCKVLQEIGYRVICLGPGKDPPTVYEGITIYSIHRTNEIERVLINKLPQIKKIIVDEGVSVIFLYGALFTQRENIQIIKWCHKRKIRVFYDQVDWLDVNWHNPFRGFIRALNHKLLNERVIPACDGVICISTFLAEYHSKRGSKTVVIPPLSIEKSSVLPHSYDKDEKNPIRFVYAGTTSDVHRAICQWKDRIDIMFEKLNDYSKEQSSKPFVLHIYGMTEEQYIGMFPIKEMKHGRKVICELGGRVVFHGSVPNRTVMERIRSADFTILIRDKKRATMAGFPTKVSESISCGTPVLCNDTSDIKNYIINGKMGFVMDDTDQMLRKAFSMSRDEILSMKAQCKNNPFYYTRFQKRMKEFLEG